MNTSECKYYAEYSNVTYTPDCCVEDGEAFNDVHPEDVSEWDYCPFCGREIVLKEMTKHPRMR